MAGLIMFIIAVVLLMVVGVNIHRVKKETEYLQPEIERMEQLTNENE